MIHQNGLSAVDSMLAGDESGVGEETIGRRTRDTDVGAPSEPAGGHTSGMDLDQWWTDVMPSTRDWLIAHNGEALSPEVVADISRSGGLIASDTWWMGERGPDGVHLSDASSGRVRLDGSGSARVTYRLNRDDTNWVPPLRSTLAVGPVRLMRAVQGTQTAAKSRDNSILGPLKPRTRRPTRQGIVAAAAG